MRVALVEPYLTGSHQAWAEGYQRHSRHDVALVAHPGRFWKWRMQGSYVTLAAGFRSEVEAHGPFDLVLATDMLHLPGFLGAAHRAASDAAVAVYMHENQLTYPVSPRDRPDEAYPMINWASMTVADAVFFNSEFHRDIWFEQVPGLLRRFPDERHDSLLDAVKAKARVLPVGVDLARLDGTLMPRSSRPVILWNQRWEYDKGPDEFAATVRRLADSGRDFLVVLAGESFVGEPDEFVDLAEVLEGRIVHRGFAPEERYIELLNSSDIVVSTARQEFFGVGITEAVYAGAFPLLPDRLVYPERIPESLHSVCLYSEPDDLFAKLGRALDDIDACREVAAELKPVMARFDWSMSAPLYDEALIALKAGSAR